MEEFTGEFEMIDARLIVVDHRYQRPLKEVLVGTIGREFKWSSFGALVCYWRNNIPYCVDGQQRLNAALSINPRPFKVPCVVFPETTIEQEAQSFLEIQVNRKAVSALEKHKAELQAKIPSALNIQRAVTQAGFSIGNFSGDPHTIQAVRALHYVYDHLGEEGVLQVLVQIRDSWPNDQTAVGSHMIKVVAEVIADQNSKYERAKMTRALSKTTPGAILRKATEIHFSVGGSKQANVRLAVKQLCKV